MKHNGCTSKIWRLRANLAIGEEKGFRSVTSPSFAHTRSKSKTHESYMSRPWRFMWRSAISATRRSPLATSPHLYADLGKLDRSLRLSHEALEISCEIGDVATEGWVLSEISGLHLITEGNVDGAMQSNLRGQELLSGAGDLLQLGHAKCMMGHIELHKGVSAQPTIDFVRAMADEIGAGTESPLGQSISILERAEAAWQAGRDDLLLRGRRTDDYSEGQRKWLVSKGVLESTRY